MTQYSIRKLLMLLKNFFWDDFQVFSPWMNILLIFFFFWSFHLQVFIIPTWLFQRHRGTNTLCHGIKIWQQTWQVPSWMSYYHENVTLQSKPFSHKFFKSTVQYYYCCFFLNLLLTPRFIIIAQCWHYKSTTLWLLFPFSLSSLPFLLPRLLLGLGENPLLSLAIFSNCFPIIFQLDRTEKLRQEWEGKGEIPVDLLYHLRSIFFTGGSMGLNLNPCAGLSLCTTKWALNWVCLTLSLY